MQLLQVLAIALASQINSNTRKLHSNSANTRVIATQTTWAATILVDARVLIKKLDFDVQLLIEIQL